LVQPPKHIQKRLKRIGRYYKIWCSPNLDEPFDLGPFDEQTNKRRRLEQRAEEWANKRNGIVPPERGMGAAQ
jgi:hypothetical protein